jgi:hypothetical protein
LTETPVVGPDIIEIQPCTEEGLVTLEAKLGGKSDTAEFFDAALLCRYINATPAFGKQRCSAEMGYGVAERKGRAVHAFKTGKIIVRRAEGREMALEHLHVVSRSLWPALKVRGGAALVECLASEGGCPAFPKPPADGGELETGRTFAEALGDARAQPRWSLIEEGLGQLRAIAEAYPQSGVTKATKEQFRKAEGPILGFIVETEDVKMASLGIPFLSASLLLDRAMQECEKLAPDAKASCWAQVVKAFEAAVGESTGKVDAVFSHPEAGGSGIGADQGPARSLLRLVSARVP